MFVHCTNFIRKSLRINESSAKSILLTFLSPYSRYTFLNIDPRYIGSSLSPSLERIKSKELVLFMQKIKEELYFLSALKKYNYGHVDLQMLEQDQQPKIQILAEHQQHISIVRQLYDNLVTSMKKNIDKENYISWMQICLKLQIINLNIWSDFVKLMLRHLKQLDQDSQLRCIEIMYEFINKKFMKYTFSPSKFIYRQNSLVDLGNLSELLLVFFDLVIHQQPSKRVSSCFSLTVSLLRKISKTTLVNFNSFLNHYIDHQEFYMNMVESAEREVLMGFVDFYAIIGIDNPEGLVQIQDKILILFRQRQPSVEQINSILSFWSTLVHKNEQIYKKHIKPAIKNNIEHISSNLGTILFNIIAAGIKDPPFFTAILNQCSTFYPIDSKIVHLVKHFLNIQNELQHISSYPQCYQHPTTFRILRQSNKIFMNCMHRNEQKSFRHSKQNQGEISYIKQQGIQHNISQEFWLTILQKVFKIISSQYPHPQNQLHLNYPFCVFELDALIVINNTFIAFELLGSQYMHKTMQKKVTDSTHGKKIIKRKIIQAYGIKMCEINSSGLIERTISSFQDKRHGQKYLLQKLQRILKQGQ